MNVIYRAMLKPLPTQYYHFNYLNELIFISARHFETTQYALSEKKFNLDHGKIVKRDGTVVRKKTEQVKLVTVIHNSTEKVLKMTDAIKLATHKGLYLVKIQKPNPKSMEFYQLSNAPEIISNSPNSKKENVKRFIFRVNIADYDLLNKARVLCKALKKQKIVSYTIENFSKDAVKSEELSDKVQRAIKDEGFNFKITNAKGTVAHRTFTVEINEQDVLS